ncbi:MAG: right-handed parallel beta-helix repeat-containing protein [Candidatus Helarchaeota archaeon]
MKNGKKKKVLRQIILLVLGICIFLVSNLESYELYDNSDYIQDNNFTIKSATTFISHEPIRIDGNAELEAFCATNGSDGLSWETAFKIENYSITSGEDSGISINNTDKFLIINNCLIENFWNNNYGASDNGINIQNCSNIKITNCLLTNNTLGIYLNSSTNIILIQNNCSYNNWGFTLLNSENNTLFNNTASYNEYDGFRISGGRNNNISTNVVSLNYQNGIFFTNYYPSIGTLYTYGNSIVNNTIEENHNYGIQIENSDFNSVLNNKILNNKDSGISLSSSSYNNLSYNVLNNNNHAGIEFLENSTWNLILNNKISENSNGIYIIDSEQNIIRENIITNHTNGYGILIQYNEEYQSEQNIYNNTFENNMQNISYVQSTYYSYEPPNYLLYVFIAVVIIGIVLLPIIFRKKITKRWKKFIAEREVKKNEQKIDEEKRMKGDGSEQLKNSQKRSDQELPKVSWLDIYISLKIIGWICVIFTMILLIVVSFDEMEIYYLIDIPILIFLFLLNRKKITKRWKKFIAERKIKKSEQKIERIDRTKINNSKSSKILVKDMKKNDSKIIYKFLKLILWSFVTFMMFLFIGFSSDTGDPYFLIDIPILIIIWLFYINKTKYYYYKMNSNILIKIGQRRTKKAINYAKTHYYKRSRVYWLSSERSYRRALKIVPNFHKIAFLEKKLTIIKQNLIASYLSEGLFLSKIAWEEFKNKHYSQAKKHYSKSILVIELILKNLESEVILNEKEEFPINTSLIFEILQVLRKNFEQIEIVEKNKKKTKDNMNSINIQNINEKIIESLKEINESLWVYCQSLDSQEDLLDLNVLSKILENKLTKSEKILDSIQDQMQYLIAYSQTSINKYVRNGIQTKPLDMNIKNTVEQERIENKHLKILREYEYIGGKIRLKVGIVNHSDNVLTNLALRFDLPDSLKWIIHEPNLKRKGDTIHLAKLGGNEKIAISLYLEPVNCLESMINATLTYFDSKDRPQAIIMTPKKVTISCPIFFTREEANLARVKKIQLQLKFEDHKVFPLVKSTKSELIFNKLLDSIGKHDVKLVDKEFSLDNNKGDAYFYGITKVKKEKMIIHLILDSNHQIIEISVNGDEQEPITGLLAELESEIRDKLLVHNIIEDSDKFHDINTSILLGNCPFCNGPISPTMISLFKKGETVKCKYCDTNLTYY